MQPQIVLGPELPSDAAPEPVGPGTTQPPRRVELVFRFRVSDEKAAKDLVDSVRSWVRTARGGADAGDSGVLDEAVGVDLLQPVIGSESTDWELRLTFPSFESLGRLADADQAGLAGLRDLGGAGVTGLDVTNPVLRRVDVEPATRSDPASAPSTAAER